MSRLERSLENIEQYIKGEGVWFSARNETAVLYQLRQLAAVVKAARDIEKWQLLTPEGFDRRFAALVAAVEALDSTGEV